MEELGRNTPMIPSATIIKERSLLTTVEFITGFLL
jgi:hypothetical protein